MADNVVQFPGMKGANKMAKQVEQGKKVTQQAALGALVDTSQKMQALQAMMGRLVQGLQELDKLQSNQAQHLTVLLSLLRENGVFTQEQWDATWKKLITDVEEQNITDYIEQLKQQSAEDAYYATVAELVRKHTFPDTKGQGDQVIPGAQIQKFYLQGVLDPKVRKQAVDDLVKNFMPDLPQMNAAPAPAPEEPARSMPECRYCGKPDCPVCNPPVEQPVVETVPEPEAVATCCAGPGEECVDCQCETKGE